VSKALVFQEDSVQCPLCDSVPHITGTALFRTKTSSGFCLIIFYECESDHRWRILFDDHSGGTWISQTLIKPTCQCP
jgi:hypothetical protein